MRPRDAQVSHFRSALRWRACAELARSAVERPLVALHDGSLQFHRACIALRSPPHRPPLTAPSRADAATTLLKTLGFYYKTFNDHNANSAAVHEDIANLYPANQRLSVAVAHLHTEGKVRAQVATEPGDVAR